MNLKSCGRTEEEFPPSPKARRNGVGAVIEEWRFLSPGVGCFYFTLLARGDLGQIWEILPVKERLS